MNRTLIKALVDQACFLATSSDDLVHPDAAVAQLEHLAAVLKELGPTERNALLDFIAEAEEQARHDSDAARADVLSALPENLGLL